MQIDGVNNRKTRQPQKPRQPRRQKKADRLLHGNQSKEQIMCDYALAPLDRLAIEMDHKWGIDVLVELVSPETAAKYGSAMAKLNEAINSNVPEDVAARSEICQRGLVAMDKEAEALGRQRASEDVWEIDGYGIMKDGRSWQAIQDQRPELKLVTLREVAVALQFYAKHGVGVMTEEAKKHFPGAEVIGMSGGSMEDDIPF